MKNFTDLKLSNVAKLMCLTFLDFNHSVYPFRFDPHDAEDFWEKLKLAIKSSEKLVLDNYFNITSYFSVREEYNKTYFEE